MFCKQSKNIGRKYYSPILYTNVRYKTLQMFDNAVTEHLYLMFCKQRKNIGRKYYIPILYTNVGNKTFANV